MAKEEWVKAESQGKKSMNEGRKIVRQTEEGMKEVKMLDKGKNEE